MWRPSTVMLTQVKIVGTYFKVLTSEKMRRGVFNYANGVINWRSVQIQCTADNIKPVFVFNVIYDVRNLTS